MHPCDLIPRRSVTVSRFESRSLTGNSASEQEPAVPPKSANETRTPHTPPISDEFVSVQTLQRKSRKGPECAEELAQDKNMRNINNLIRGGASGIRTMNLAGRIRLKTHSKSAR